MESKDAGLHIKSAAKATRLTDAKHKYDSPTSPSHQFFDNESDDILRSAGDVKHSLAADDKVVYRGTLPVAGNKAVEPNLASDVRERRHSRDIKESDAMDESDAEEGDAEFLALMKKPNTGEAMVSADPTLRRIALGLKVNYMNMRDAETNTLVWESYRFGNMSFESEMNENIPKSILNSRAISREINFTSREEVKHFRIEQRVFFHGQCIEEWFFSFGFVIPGSTNSWEQIIEAAPPNAMLSAEQLSGYVTIETSFLDNKQVLCKNLVRVFYV